MREYLITLICVGCICGMAEAIAPRGKGDGLLKHVKLICSLCVLCVVAVPIGEMFAELRNGEVGFFGDIEAGAFEDKYTEDFYETLNSYNADAVSRYLEAGICETFSVDDEDVEISCDISIENEQCTIDSVTVCIGFSAVGKDPHAMRKYVEDTTGAVCEIIYK